MKRVDLHNHLDGSLPPKTILELAKMSEVSLPVDSVAEITRYLTVSPDCTSLNEYLEKFDIPVSVMQTEDCLEKAVYDLLANLSQKNVCYAEIRFAPGQHLKKGLTQTEVVSAAVKGLIRAETDFPIFAQLILCCMRGANEPTNRTTIDVTKQFLNQGVCCADLAGAEAIFPTKDYIELFEYAKQTGVPFVIHAGEADGPESIWTAISMGTRRIGHGIAAIRDDKLMQYLKSTQIPLEVCVTSNVQTKGVNSIYEHPILKMLEYGLNVTINTDNMTVSGTTLDHEFELIEKTFKMNDEQVHRLTKNAIDAAFLSDAQKEKLRKLILS